MNATVRSTWEAPRWAGVESFIRNAAFMLDLECHVEVEKGWIYEHGRFSVSGEENAVRHFKELFDEAAKRYNS